MATEPQRKTGHRGGPPAAATIDWRFTTADVGTTLERLYPMSEA